MYMIEHPDGRRVYYDRRIGRRRLYVSGPLIFGEHYALYTCKTRKHAERICARTNEVWSGFEVKEIQNEKKL